MVSMIGRAIMGLTIGWRTGGLPGRQHLGLILTILLGMAGTWLGGMIGRVTGMYEEGKPAGFVMAIVGGLVVLVIYSLPTRSSTALLLPLV